MHGLQSQQHLELLCQFNAKCLTFGGQLEQANVGLVNSQVGRGWPGCKHADGPGAGHMVRPFKAGDTGSKIARACYLVPRKVETWASIEQSQ